MALSQDDSLENVVTNHPIEAIILWTKLHQDRKILLSKCIVNCTRQELVKLYYMAIVLASYDVVELHQNDMNDVLIEKSKSFSKFSQCIKLDGEYHSKMYMPSLLELSRLGTRSLIITSSNSCDIERINNTLKNLNLPNNVIEYVSFKGLYIYN